ncbi:MAG: PqqD family peptide modification chaperone [Candidatus Geothermarchaeales archaeon]
MRKRGQLSKNDEGSLILINEDGQSYNINQSVVTIWRKCHGKTQVELSREIAEERSLDFDEVNSAMTNIIGQLIKAGLVEDVEEEPEQIRGMELGKGIDMGITRPATPLEMEGSQQFREKLQNMIKALRDIQKRLDRIEEKIDNMKRFELKAGDKLVLKEEEGKLLIEKA